MNLGKLLQGIDILDGRWDPALEITGVSYDSRETKPGDLFVAMTGCETDGHRFIPMALEKGAACVLCEKAPEEDVPCVRTSDSRAALARVGINWFADPAASMKLVGVTGTNQNMIGSEIVPTERTTPESFELQRLFRRMADAGCTHVVMEVSSHALSLKRVEGVRFAVGIFTNLTQDHLDFHGTMENYCDAKARLFRQCGVGVYNADDPWAERIMAGAACGRISIGEGEADLAARNITLSAGGIAFDAAGKKETVAVRVGIPGGFMVYNTLGVLAAAKALGVPLGESARILRHSAHVKGRVEVVPTPGDYTMLIDYAHTPDALANVLTSLRGFARGRVVALFGCGGDRDRTKRPLMGKIAADLADFVIVTSDNPRTEAPHAIIADIVEGMVGTETEYVVVENRIDAIRFAMDHARQGDVILLAGKGHETYQIVGHEKRHLDEREVVAAYIQELQQQERA